MYCNASQLAAVSLGPLGFDPEEWKNNHDSNSRSDMMCKFFRGYNVVGMTVAQLHSLLGEPDTTAKYRKLPSAMKLPQHAYDQYNPSAWQCGYSKLYFEYTNGRVTRYCSEHNGSFSAWRSDNEFPNMDRGW
jgi:hypothetical protein